MPSIFDRVAPEASPWKSTVTGAEASFSETGLVPPPLRAPGFASASASVSFSPFQTA